MKNKKLWKVIGVGVLITLSIISIILALLNQNYLFIVPSLAITLVVTEIIVASSILNTLKKDGSY